MYSVHILDVFLLKGRPPTWWPLPVADTTPLAIDEHLEQPPVQPSYRSAPNTHSQVANVYIPSTGSDRGWSLPPGRRWREKGGRGSWQHSQKKKMKLKLKLWGVCVGFFLGSLQFNQWDKLKLGTFAIKCRQQSCRFTRTTLDKKLCNGNSKDAEVQCFCLLPQVPPRCLHRNRISDYQL